MQHMIIVSRTRYLEFLSWPKALSSSIHLPSRIPERHSTAASYSLHIHITYAVVLPDKYKYYMLH